MLNNILNIEGVSLLPKEQQKAINGGNMEICHVLVEGADGSQHPYVTFGSGGEASCAGATDDYVNEKGGTFGRCRYDCGSDGYTATWWDPSWGN
ncbi:hypothetical protein ACV07N_00605 [Roseivirga echinicomitans]